MDNAARHNHLRVHPGGTHRLVICLVRLPGVGPTGWCAFLATGGVTAPGYALAGGLFCVGRFFCYQMVALVRFINLVRTFFTALLSRAFKSPRSGRCLEALTR